MSETAERNRARSAEAPRTRRIEVLVEAVEAGSTLPRRLGYRVSDPNDRRWPAGDGSVVHVRTGDYLEWTSNVGAFAVIFADRTPIERFDFAGRKGEISSHQVSGRNRPGEEHKYWVVLYDEKSGEMVQEDPKIIID